MQPIRVGLVGAGYWAETVHAPMLAAGPETRLAGVWARRPHAAAALAGLHGAPAFADFDELLAACDAVAFAVAPAAQTALAVRAARAGKALLLEKPLAVTLEAAVDLAAAVCAAGVPSLLFLTFRFMPGMAAFAAAARAGGAFAARTAFVTGSFVAGSPYAGGWRMTEGALLDVGPHALDMAIQALGPVTSLRAEGDAARWVSLLLGHEGGATSEIAIPCAVPGGDARIGIEAFGPFGIRAFDASGAPVPETFAAVRAAFAEAVVSGRSSAGAEYGLELQRLIAEATAQLRV